jgi:hypothetical protein
MENTVRDHLWVWGHEEGSHNADWNLPAKSRITPLEGAVYLGIPNLLMVVYNNLPEPPFDRLAVAFRPLQKVIWSIVGDASSTRNNQKTDLDEVLKLAGKFPNTSGAIMDDFFHTPDEKGEISRLSVAALRSMREQLHAAAHPLDLWTVTYQADVAEPQKKYLNESDGVTLWSWKLGDLAHLEGKMDQLETLLPDKRKMLGIYMYDYDLKQPVPVAPVEFQCRLGLDWLRKGRIEGIIFLATCICDLELEAVEYVRRWVAEVGSEHLR